MVKHKFTGKTTAGGGVCCDLCGYIQECQECGYTLGYHQYSSNCNGKQYDSCKGEPDETDSKLVIEILNIESKSNSEIAEILEVIANNVRILGLVEDQFTGTNGRIIANVAII